MKKTDRGSRLTRAFFGLIASSLVVFAFMMLSPGAASAADDAEGDAKLQAMRADLMSCMEPQAAGQKAKEAFAKKYDVPLSALNAKLLDTPPTSNGGWPEWWATIVCNIEIYSAVGENCLESAVRYGAVFRYGCDALLHCVFPVL
ncbi:hypothetical protein [Trichlorobacter lovleyi]|uniref:hypothetical protein n=1 Tax=Trichlorobacter lovleyi TaxID=313985 RepID=UPI0024814566|nr:hypothetical protein [Trichlorobacter lovleyi]